MTIADAYDKIESALDAPNSERPHFIKQAIQVLPEEHPAIEQLEAALRETGQNDAVAKYALRQAYGELPSSDLLSNSGLPVTRPPESVRWLGDDWGAVTVVLSDAIIEWIDIERDEETVAEWIETTVWQALDDDFITNHAFTADVEIEVPEDFAARAQLKARDRQRHGEDIDVSEVAVNYMRWDATFTLNGEPLSQDGSELGGDIESDNGTSGGD